MSVTAAVRISETFVTFEEIEALIRGFESGTLLRPQWTHRAHLTVACWYLVCYPEPEATRRIREGIQRYNQSRGIVATKDSGYHETMTLFWIRMARHYLSGATLRRSLVGLINEMAARYADRKLPFEYYSRDRLMSWEARANWVEPDLKALP
jgi:hypothetical protein